MILYDYSKWIVLPLLYETPVKITSNTCGFYKPYCGRLTWPLFRLNEPVKKLTNPHIDTMTAMAIIPHKAFDLNFASSSGWSLFLIISAVFHKKNTTAAPRKMENDGQIRVTMR